MRSRRSGWTLSFVGTALSAALLSFAWPSAAEAKPKAKVEAAKKDGKPKKVASKDKAKKKVVAKKAAPAKPCVGPSVTLDRGGLEAVTMALVDCKDVPRGEARAELSVLARPFGSNRPAKVMTPAKDATEISPGIKVLDEGLVARLASIAKKFPKQTITVVSGYRPQSKGSQHQSGKALDIRVTGVSNEDLVTFCKTLTDTGCGYYPNSSFVHLDVREKGTGSLSWIDASGPGESPRYVAQWPEPEIKDAKDPVVAKKDDDKPHVCDVPKNDKRDDKKDEPKAQAKVEPLKRGGDGVETVKAPKEHDDDGPVRPAVIAEKKAPPPAVHKAPAKKKVASKKKKKAKKPAID